jgi:hypothetical protein
MAGKGSNYGVGEGMYGKGWSPSGDLRVADHYMGKGKGDMHAGAIQKGWGLIDAEWGQGWGPTIGKGWDPSFGKGWGMDMGKGSVFWYPMGPTGWGGKPCWHDGPPQLWFLVLGVPEDFTQVLIFCEAADDIMLLVFVLFHVYLPVSM